MTDYRSVKDEIKRAADAVELIGQFVHLRKAGRNYVGLCPFHAEKAPSFTVNPERQTYHCFGCKKGGDVISFWMEYHSSTFPEALRDLADRYQISIPERVWSSEEKAMTRLRKTLFQVNEKAAAYFQNMLADSEKGKEARRYLEGRAVNREVISLFRLGYAPDEWEGLTSFLRAQKIPMKTAVEAGLVIPKKNGGYYDRFRGRIIFPIFDVRGVVIGFGGRVLDDKLPKYLNSPETPVFQKGETLYGLHLSHSPIREKKRSVMVEGYMDCLSLYVNGVKEVVATLGTAITEQHVRRMKGYAPETVVLFDADRAGIEAALKSMAIFLNEGHTAKAVSLPEGHDPDSYVNENGLEKLKDLLDSARPMFDFYMDFKLNYSDSDIEGKVRAMKDIIPVLSELEGDTQRALYVKRLAERMGIKENVVLSELEKWHKKRPSKQPGKRGEGSPSSGKVGKGSIGDVQILSLMLFYPKTVPRLIDADCRVMLSDPTVMHIVDAIFKKYSEEKIFAPEDLHEDLESEDACAMLRNIMHQPFSVYSEDEVEQAILDFERQVDLAKISESIKRVKGDTEALNQLLELKRLKERQGLQ